MLTATVLAIFYVPIFFVLVMRYFTKKVSAEDKQKKADKHNKALNDQIQMAKPE